MDKEKFEHVVDLFLKKKDENNEALNMHYLLMKQDDRSYLHRFKQRTVMSDVRSISKTVLTLVTGIVVKLSYEGKYPFFNEETFIYPIIKDVIHLTNKQNVAHLKQIQVKHLLTHTIGYNEVLLMRQDIIDIDPNRYVDLLVNHPIVYKPGEYYLYSNAGFYLLSVVLQEFLQEDLLGFINRELFTPLHIKKSYWEKYGDYLAGATRLWLLPKDLLKIGELLLHNGKFNNHQLILGSWINKMTSATIYTEDVDTPNAIFRRYAYGYGIWLAKENDIFFGHGTDGQTLIIIPEKNTIIMTMAEQVDMKPIEEILNDMIENEMFFNR